MHAICVRGHVYLSRYLERIHGTRKDSVESPYSGSTSSHVLGALHKRSAASMCDG